VLPRLPVHVTFFTRASCGLCVAAREVLAAAWQQRPFEYTEVDVMAAAGRWRDAYEFDVPVVHIVPARAVAPRAQDGRGDGVGGDGVVADVHGTGTHGERRKIMHRFTVDQVVGVLREVQELAEKGARGA
jgi:glutaredoxin